MTVAEVIEALQEFDPKTRVLVNGYEGGYDDIAISEVIPVVLNVHREWYYGKHDEVRMVTQAIGGKKQIDAVILKRI